MTQVKDRVRLLYVSPERGSDVVDSFEATEDNIKILEKRVAELNKKIPGGHYSLDLVTETGSHFLRRRV